jgi:hypothetical protein
VAMAVSSTWMARGSWRSGSTIGRPERAIRCCTPTWSSPTVSKDRTDAGQPWTVAISTATAWPRTPSTGLPTSASCPARSDSLGVEWTAADHHGNRELQGMPEELVRGFSKRTGQIDTELDRLAEDGRERTPRLVKWAVQVTRKPKQQEPPDTLYGRWRQEAAERGVDADTLVRQVTGRTANRVQDQTVSEEVTGHLFDRLAGPQGLTEHASTFAHQDVLVALGAGLAGAGRTKLEELADWFLAERAVSVVADRALEERRWSAPDLLAVE